MIFKNPVAIIIVLGVCVLPALYAWYIVAANWDPYSNTDSLKVAVANDDLGADSSYTGHINVGDEIVEELKDNHELDWQFVSHDQAVDGVYSGQYYAALVFPQQFSSDFISILSGDFKKPQIEYYANEKLSGSGTKVTDTGADSVETKVNEAFVSTVTDKIIDISKDVGLQIEANETKAEGSLSESVVEAKTAIAENESLLNDLVPTIDSSIQSVAGSKDLVSTLQNDIPSLDDDLSSASDSLETIRSTINKYSSDISSTTTAAALALSEAAAQTSIAAGKLAGEISQAKSTIDASLSNAKRVLDDNNRLLEALRQSQDGAASGLDSVISSIENENSSLSSTITSLETLSDSLAQNIEDAAAAQTDISDTVSKGVSDIRNAASYFQNDIVPEIDSSLDSFSSALGTLRGSLSSFDPVLQDAGILLDQLSSTLSSAKTSCENASQSLGAIQSNLERTASDLQALQNSATFGALRDLIAADPSDIASFMSSPVSLKTTTLYPVATYGSGVAPFFSNLGFWVCGFIIVAIIRQRVNPKGLPKFSPIQGYFGRWLTCIAICIVQGLVLGIGDLVIGVQCVSPAAFIGACLLSVFVYVNLIYALAFSAKHIGKAIAVILLVMQIPGSSGLFPIETMPEFYQAINPFLPFTYSIAAMREAIGGFYGNHYLVDMLALGLGFIPLGLIIGFLGIKFGYNINKLFDQKLSKTDLFIADSVAPNEKWFRPRAALQALLSTKQYRKKIIVRAKTFTCRYPKLELIGWVALIGLPIIMLVTLIIFHLSFAQSTPDEKLLLLTVFIIGMIVLMAYLIIINYLNADIKYQLDIASHHDAVKHRRNTHAKRTMIQPAQSGTHTHRSRSTVKSQKSAPDSADAHGDDRGGDADE